MYCTHCGEQIEDNSRFCPYCGKNILVVNEDTPKEDVKKNTDKPFNMSKIVKFIFSFVLGMILSLITALLIERSFFMTLALIIFSWIGIGLAAYTIILKLSGSNGIGGLGGIIIGGIGMWVLTNIIGHWVEAVEMADTGLGAFLLLLPVGLIWTFIVYTIASVADNKNSENQ